MGVGYITDLWFLWTGVIPKTTLALSHDGLLAAAYALLLLSAAAIWYGRERAKDVSKPVPVVEEERLAA